MYPPPFDYSSPTSLEEASSLLTELGDDGRVLAGGQSLLPMMKLRLASPAHLVDINRIPGLDGIQLNNGHLEIGALVRHADVVSSQEVADASPLMASTAPWVADPLVRNVGTVCGSVAHCDPEGDWNSVMLALGAEVMATSSSGAEMPFLDHLEATRHNTPASRNCRLAAIRGFVAHLLRHDIARAARIEGVLVDPDSLGIN